MKTAELTRRLLQIQYVNRRWRKYDIVVSTDATEGSDLVLERIVLNADPAQCCHIVV